MHISDWSSDVCSSDLVAMVAEKQIRLRDDRFQDRRRIGLPPVPQAPAPIAIEGHADPGCAGAGDGFERGGGAVGPERRRDAPDVEPADAIDHKVPVHFYSPRRGTGRPEEPRVGKKVCRTCKTP